MSVWRENARRDRDGALGVRATTSDSPPGFAARGLDGTVIASGLLDELSRLQDATRSGVQRLDLANAWAIQVKLEVPETGISLGEISRLLKQRFGHDVHIDGDLIETPAGGLALTVRGNGVPAKTFDGSAAKFEQLTVAAAPAERPSSIFRISTLSRGIWDRGWT